MAGDAFKIDLQPVYQGLLEFGVRVERGVFAAIEWQRGPAESWMRTNASWTDQTTNARNGLIAMSAHKPGLSHELILAHTVPYGIWLEVRFAGRYAIIDRSIVNQGNAVMKNISGLFGKI